MAYEWHPEGGYIAYLSDVKGYPAIGWIDFQSREREWLVDDPEGEAELFVFSQDGSKLLHAFNQRGEVITRVLDLPSREVSEVSVGEGDLTYHVGMVPTGEMVLIHTDARRPRDLYFYDPKAEAVQQLTDSFRGLVDPDELVDAQSVEWPSLDGRKIHDFLYRPTFLPTSPPPGILLIHRGPTA